MQHDKKQRDVMVLKQIAARGVRNPKILDAMRTVPRHEFVPTKIRSHSYRDRPLPIGYEQTISQPVIVAKMLELAQPQEGEGPETWREWSEGAVKFVPMTRQIRD